MDRVHFIFILFKCKKKLYRDGLQSTKCLEIMKSMQLVTIYVSTPCPETFCLLIKYENSWTVYFILRVLKFKVYIGFNKEVEKPAICPRQISGPGVHV